MCVLEVGIIQFAMIWIFALVLVVCITGVVSKWMDQRFEATIAKYESKGSDE